MEEPREGNEEMKSVILDQEQARSDEFPSPPDPKQIKRFSPNQLEDRGDPANSNRNKKPRVQNENVQQEQKLSISVIMEKDSEGAASQMIKIDEHSQSYSSYYLHTFINAILSAVTVGLVKMVYRRTNITAYEIIYARSALIAFTMFFYLLFKGVYALEVEEHLRGKVLLRGGFTFIGLVLFYTSIMYIESLSYCLIFQFGALGVAHYLSLNPERRTSTDLLALTLSLLSVFMIVFETLEKNKLNTDSHLAFMIGMGLAISSGIILEIVSRMTLSTCNLRYEILQSFYANCICACFCPFFILKDVSDRKKLTQYGQTEFEILGIICIIGVIQALWIERGGIMIRFIENPERKLVNLGFLQLILVMLIDLMYFDLNPFGQKEVVSIICSLGAMGATALLSYSKEVQFSF